MAVGIGQMTGMLAQGAASQPAPLPAFAPPGASPFSAPGTPEPSNLGVAQPTNVALTDEQRAKLVTMMNSAITYYTSAINPLIVKATRWQELYQVISKQKDTPWKNASNYEVPLLAEKIMSIHARIVRAAFNVSPIWLVKANSPEVVENTEMVERWLSFLAENGRFKAEIDLAMLDGLLQGTGILKIDYARQERQYTDASTAQKFSYTDFEGPRLKVIPLQDFFILPLTVRDIDDATAAGHRFWLTPDELRQRANANVYDMTVVNDLIASNSVGTQQKVLASPIFGQLPDVPIEVRQSFQLYEFFWKLDLNNTGEVLPYTITYSNEKKVILRMIAYPFDHGRAPYIGLRPIPNPNLFFGQALAQYLEPIQVELTSSYQRRSDAISLKTLPPILRKRGSTWKPEKQPLGPNVVIDVNDQSDITLLQAQSNVYDSFQSDSMLIQLGERITGMSDYQLGRSAGSNRTYGEVKSVLSEGQIRIDVLLDRVQVDLQRLGDLTYDIGYQFLPNGGLFEVSSQFFNVTPEILRPPGLRSSPYRIIPNGTMSEGSKDAAFEQMMVLSNQFLASPLNNVQIMAQVAGPAAPQAIQQVLETHSKLWKKILDEAGWLDSEKYLPLLAQLQAQQSQAQQMPPDPSQQPGMPQAPGQPAVDPSQAIAMLSQMQGAPSAPQGVPQ